MAKFLKDIIGETYVMESSAHPNTQGTHSRSEDEERFVAKHKPSRFDNMYTTGEHAADYDKVFGAGNINMANRKDHGYTGSPTPSGPLQEPKPGEDAAVYEDVQLDEDNHEKFFHSDNHQQVNFFTPHRPGEHVKGTLVGSVHDNNGAHIGHIIHAPHPTSGETQEHVVPLSHVVPPSAHAYADPRFDD